MRKFNDNAGSLPIANRILAQLPPEEYERLAPHLAHVTLALGDVTHYPQ